MREGSSQMRLRYGAGRLIGRLRREAICADPGKQSRSLWLYSERRTILDGTAAQMHKCHLLPLRSDIRGRTRASSPPDIRPSPHPERLPESLANPCATCEAVSTVIASEAKQSILLACRGMDCFVASLPCANASRLSQAMTWRERRNMRASQSRLDHNRRSLADRRTHLSRHTPPHCCRNSNLPAPMRGRASVQLLPACETYG